VGQRDDAVNFGVMRSKVKGHGHIEGEVRFGDLRRVFHFYFYVYEILTDSVLATHRHGKRKFSCLQFVSSAPNVASEVMETLCVFVQIQY